MRRSACHFLAVAFITLAAACSSGGSGTPDAGGGGVSVTTCSTDAECTSLGFVCDTIRRECVCTKDAMCAGKREGAYCNTFTGRCVADVEGCKGDGECQNNEFCDVALRTCRPKRSWCAPCTQDEECGGPNDHCVRHPDFLSAPAFCAAGCDSGDVCPQGQACRDTEKGKQCIPSVGRCQANYDCNPDTGQNCQVDGDCTQGNEQICDAGSKRCVAASTTCEGGQVCDPVTRSCVNACRTDAECQERYSDDGFQCVRNTCVRAENCYAPDQCPRGKYCYKAPNTAEGQPGTCIAGCSADPTCVTACGGGNACEAKCADQSCPLGNRCLENGQGASECQPGCVQRTAGDNTGCPLNAICVGGQCEFEGAGGVRRCQVDAVCQFKQKCSNNSCVPAPDHCKNPSAGCGTGKTGTLFFNPVCGSGSTMTCPAGASKVCNLNLGSCVGCACRIDRCLFTCQSDAQCPNGFYCTDGAVSTDPFGTYCYPTDPGRCL